MPLLILSAFQLMAAILSMHWQASEFALVLSQFQEIEILNDVDFTPTISGESENRAVIGRMYTNPNTGQEEELFSVELPDGTGFGYTPSPMVQATIGLIKDTDVSLGRNCEYTQMDKWA